MYRLRLFEGERLLRRNDFETLTEAGRWFVEGSWALFEEIAEPKPDGSSQTSVRHDLRVVEDGDEERPATPEENEALFAAISASYGDAARGDRRER